jgi:hypothetical protein
VLAVFEGVITLKGLGHEIELKYLMKWILLARSTGFEFLHEFLSSCPYCNFSHSYSENIREK